MDTAWCNPVGVSIPIEVRAIEQQGTQDWLIGRC